MESTSGLKVDVSMPLFPTPPPTSGKSSTSSSPSDSSSTVCSEQPSTVPMDSLSFDHLLASVLPSSTAFQEKMKVTTGERSDRTPNGEKIKRPMNAFMVWAQIRRAEITATQSKVHNSQISKTLGIEWRELSDAQKEPFVQKAKQLRDELFREHPNYVYRPRKRKPRSHPYSPKEGGQTISAQIKTTPTSLNSSSPPSSLIPGLGASPTNVDIDLSALKTASTSPEAVVAALASTQFLPMSLYQGLLPQSINPLLLNPLIQSTLYQHLLSQLTANH